MYAKVRKSLRLLFLIAQKHFYGIFLGKSLFFLNFAETSFLEIYSTYDSTDLLNYIKLPMPTQHNFLFFDTETTGIPRDYKAPCTNTDNWPRLVQLGWILSDDQGTVLRCGNKIVRPEGFVIPTEASAVHGITTERALTEGEDLRVVIHSFGRDLNEAHCLVGHNIDYDLHIVGSEYHRLGYDYRVMFARPYVCTMQSTIEYCNIPGKYGPKWPKLQELHLRLFDREFSDAHDAMADIAATKDCFFELLRRGVIRL